MYFLFIDIDGSDYSTQEDTSDTNYLEEENGNENDIYILINSCSNNCCRGLLYKIYCKRTL